MSGDRDCGSGVFGGRRRLARAGLGGVAALAAGLVCGPLAASGARTEPAAGGGLRPSGPVRAWRELAAGNARWRTFHESHPDRARAVRRALVGGQHPFAVVLGCVDSRVPPELVFDQGLGDLLTVRSAGEVLDEAVLGSIAYGVLELAVPLIVVLGHQGCGAVTAAVHADDGAELPAHIRFLADRIRPAIDHRLQGEARVDAAVTEHVRRVRARLAAEPDLAARIADGRLAVVGARYELTSQRVHKVS
ncbi:carbonic anhydrase [Streptomyces sp. NPDC086023]|uniref:carbonic anhydrase n=1 Tax=Streptomyces sp. NPDC086023 TaxID=3365746 RepID=UPI0037CD94B0